MAVRHYNVLLTGAAQRLSSVLADTTPGGPFDDACRQILFSADPANGAAIYVGTAASISATDHGFSLDPTQASQLPVSVGPFPTGPMKLSEFWVLGTNNERLHVLVLPY